MDFIDLLTIIKIIMPIEMKKISVEKLQKVAKRKEVGNTQEAKMKKLGKSSLAILPVSTPTSSSNQSPVPMEVPVPSSLVANSTRS